MTSIPARDVVDALLPSLGYFGGSALDCLDMSVGMAVSSVRLEIDSDQPTYLNLRGIEFLGDDGPVDPVIHGYRIRQSSVQKNNEGRKDEALLERKGIHTQREQRPSWEIFFDRPVPLRSIRLWNRADGWGSRTRMLVVSVQRFDSTRAEIHRSQSQETIDRVLATFRHVTGVQLVDPSKLNAGTAGMVRTGAMALLAKLAREGDLAVAARDWVDLVAFTGIWSSTEPTNDEWTVLAAYLVAQKQEKPNFGTSVKTMSLLLKSRERLKRLEAELNGLGRRRQMGNMMLSRHGVRSEGVLRQKSGAYVSHLKQVMRALEGGGYACMLAYGTLLGAVREGRFLAHDDDVDIMYHAKATNRKDLEAEIRRIGRMLADAGFRAEDLLPKHLNMHVVSKTGGIVVDVFPCWLSGGLMSMHMEGMAIRGLPPEIILPPREVLLEGEPFPAPADPEAFLAERYGSGWKVPDPYHDWPWRLDS